MITKSLIAAAAVAVSLTALAPVQQAQAKVNVDINLGLGGGFFLAIILTTAILAVTIPCRPLLWRHQLHKGKNIGIGQASKCHAFYCSNRFQYMAWKFGQSTS